MINEDLQKEWNDHLKDWCITLGMSKFLDLTNYYILELSSTISGYALDLALGIKPPVALPRFYPTFIKSYMFSSYVMDSYLWSKGRKERFLEYLKSELLESKENLKKHIDLRTGDYKDR